MLLLIIFVMVILVFEGPLCGALQSPHYLPAVSPSGLFIPPHDSASTMRPSFALYDYVHKHHWSPLFP